MLEWVLEIEHESLRDARWRLAVALTAACKAGLPHYIVRLYGKNRLDQSERP